MMRWPHRSPEAPVGVASLELSRDIYGFTVRPQHLKRYREYADIYKVEEAERADRWEHFLRTYNELPIDNVASDEEEKLYHLEKTSSEVEREANREKNEPRRMVSWNPVLASLLPIERALNAYTKKGYLSLSSISRQESGNHSEAALLSGSSAGTAGDGLTAEDDSDEEFYDVERSDMVQDGIQFEISATDNVTAISDHGQNELENISKSSSPLTHELEALVRQGVPMALRGELWQVFVGTRTRRLEGHYNSLLMSLASDSHCTSNTSSKYIPSDPNILDKWTSQIEKDLPRTFPGHPALDEDGRNALRRLLTAYACHNPDVGYCQAMNFFAALLLLMMPEENAFWTLTGIIDDYFEGYYSEKMLEAQVDQLVFNELVREHLPKLVSHMDMLGVQLVWITGPWFLSIFINILPWDSVLRVWDVLLYEGSRSMLFRTALALLELHGPVIMGTKDAGDAVAMLQSLAGGTFDSSHLVLVACMSYQMVDETRLQRLRQKYKPEESSKSEVFSGMHPVKAQSGSMHKILMTGDVSEDLPYLGNSNDKSSSSALEGEFLSQDVTISSNTRLDNMDSSASDLLEQVNQLKAELCRALEENRVATLRAEELEIAFMELVQEDNRRLLCAKVESLEAEVVSLRLSLKEKEEQEQAMVQVVLRMEQEQRSAEDARRFAEQDSVAQHRVVDVLQEKYNEVLSSLAEMEKRVVMAESMLEATLQYQTLGSNQTPRHGADSPLKEEETPKSLWSRMSFSSRPVDSDNSPKGASAYSHVHKKEREEGPSSAINDVNTLQVGDPPRKQGLLSRSFVLSWRDKVKGKAGEGMQSPTAPAHENVTEAELTSVNPLFKFDGSSQDSTYYKHGESVSGELSHLNGSVASMDISDNKEFEKPKKIL